MKKNLQLSLLLGPLLLLVGCSHTISKVNHPEAQKLSYFERQYNQHANRAWQPIVINNPIYAKKSAAALPEIRKRLAILGDFKATKYTPWTSTKYDKSLLNAIKQFQFRHGLKADGVIGKETVRILNISPQQRLSQLKKAKQDFESLSQLETTSDYILVNIASAELKVFQGQSIPLAMRVVVGNSKWPTPTLKSELKTVVLNPKWNVPRNITEKELIHKIVEDPTYLSQENITVIDGWHKGAKPIDPASIDWQKYAGDEDLPYRLMQSAGESNALGKVKFTFPNKEHVYLHDTPYKAAFNLENRNLSHGCVRLQYPMKLLDYLISSNHLGYKERISNHLQQGVRTMHYALKKSLPLYIKSISAWVDKNGLLHFRGLQI